VAYDCTTRCVPLLEERFCGTSASTPVAALVAIENENYNPKEITCWRAAWGERPNNVYGWAWPVKNN